jgi:hypothetical protein
MHSSRGIRQWYRISLVVFVGVLCITGTRLYGQGQPAAQLDRDALLGHLNAVITWYRDVTTKVQPTGLPSDAIYQDNSQNLAAQVYVLLFYRHGRRQTSCPHLRRLRRRLGQIRQVRVRLPMRNQSPAPRQVRMGTPLPALAGTQTRPPMQASLVAHHRGVKISRRLWLASRRKSMTCRKNWMA